MPTDPGDALILWTARLMVGCYFARVVIHLWQRGPQKEPAARLFWTLGCGLLLAHLAAAFGFRHHWSHAAAYAHTAARTAAVTGLNWGGGIWFNYAFALFWTADVVRCWRKPADSPEPGTRFYTVHAVFALMMLNATAVFGPWWWKWAAAIAMIVLGALWSLRRQSPPK